MILRELFYYDKNTLDVVDDNSYESEYDQSVVDFDDTRKTRLTLAQINRVRKASELHTKEKTKELDFIRQMYGMAAQEAQAGAI